MTIPWGGHLTYAINRRGKPTLIEALDVLKFSQRFSINFVAHGIANGLGIRSVVVVVGTALRLEQCLGAMFTLVDFFVRLQ